MSIHKLRIFAKKLKNIQYKKMKRTVIKCLVTLCCMAFTMPAMAQFNLKKAINSAAKATKAVTLTDEEMKEYILNRKGNSASD